MSGPLLLKGHECRRKTERITLPSGRRQVVAKAESCISFYRYDPEREDDQGNDYGIVWLQTMVDSRNGWCATRVDSDTIVPIEGEPLQRAPSSDIKITKAHRVRIKLRTDAGGHGDQTASLSKGVLLRPRRVAPSVTEQQSNRVFRIRWTGRSARRMNFASGVEIRWDIQDPPATMTSDLSYTFEKREGCR